MGAADTDDHGEALEQARAGVVERLRARRPEIDEAIFARVRDVAPGAVGLADPTYMVGLREAITAGVDYVLAGLEGAEQVAQRSPQIPSAAVAQARRAAREGVGLETVLRRYVVGHAILGDFVMQEADHSDFVAQRTALRGVFQTSAALLDRLIPSIVSAYTQELEQAGGAPAPADAAPAAGRGGQSVDRMRSAAADTGASSTSHEEQRLRIMQALVEVLAGHGFAGTTVGLIVTRAKVSRRTFYEIFDGLEDCLMAVMDRALEQVVALASRELEGAQSWQDGVRSALAEVLSFFDREPELARVCIVETLAGGPVVLEHRERVIAAFRVPVIERIEKEVSPVSPLTAEGVMGSVLGIMHAHIVAQKPGPFVELLGPLMGLATAPQLGARGVEQEIQRGDELARAILNTDSRWSESAHAPRQDTEQNGALPGMLAAPSARRARECLAFLAEHPESSNREVAVGIDVAHQSQISKLLAHLCEENLVIKRSEGAGKRNAWRLTPHGEGVARALMERQR